MDDQAQGVDRLARNEHVQLDQRRSPIARFLVVHRGVALAAALELVVVVDDELGQGHLEGHEHALRVEVLHVDKGAAVAGREIHQGSDVPARGDDPHPDPGLLDGLDVARAGHQRGVVHGHRATPVGEVDPVLHGRGARDQVEVELAFEPLLDDLHVEQAQEPAAEAEAERDRALGLVGEARIVEVELLEGLAQQRVVLTAERIDPREDEALRLLVAGQWGGGRGTSVGQGVADLGIADVLESGCNVADLAGPQDRDRHELGPEHAQLEQLRLHPGGHQPDRVVGVERPGGQPDIDHDALVRVVVGIEDQALERRARIALGAGDPLDDGLEDGLDPDALLGAGEDDLLARDGQDVLELLDDHLGLGRWQVDLVDDRDDREVLAQGEVDVGQGLGLDPLGRIDDQDRPLAGLQAAAHLVGEIDVPGRVDQVEPVDQTVLGRIVEPDRARLDRDPLLALEVHGVEHLAGHLPGVDGVGELEQTIGQGGFAVVDVGDDAEVAKAGLRYRVAQVPPRSVASDGAWSCCSA